MTQEEQKYFDIWTQKTIDLAKEKKETKSKVTKAKQLAESYIKMRKAESPAANIFIDIDSEGARISDEEYDDVTKLQKEELNKPYTPAYENTTIDDSYVKAAAGFVSDIYNQNQLSERMGYVSDAITGENDVAERLGETANTAFDNVKAKAKTKGKDSQPGVKDVSTMAAIKSMSSGQGGSLAFKNTTMHPKAQAPLILDKVEYSGSGYKGTIPYKSQDLAKYAMQERIKNAALGLKEDGDTTFQNMYNTRVKEEAGYISSMPSTKRTKDIKGSVDFGFGGEGASFSSSTSGKQSVNYFGGGGGGGDSTDKKFLTNLSDLQLQDGRTIGYNAFTGGLYQTARVNFEDKGNTEGVLRSLGFEEEMKTTGTDYYRSNQPREKGERVWINRRTGSRVVEASDQNGKRAFIGDFNTGDEIINLGIGGKGKGGAFYNQEYK